ncbi:hypothetical protein Tco_0732425 [Tanacetum coccineum]
MSLIGIIEARRARFSEQGDIVSQTAAIRYSKFESVAFGKISMTRHLWDIEAFLESRIDDEIMAHFGGLL